MSWANFDYDPLLPTAPYLTKDFTQLFFKRHPVTGKRVWASSRVKIAEGGRGGGKTWDMGRMAVVLGSHPKKKQRFLCVREYQTSIRDSIHRVLSDQIETLKLSRYYDKPARDGITSKYGSDFIFAGIATDPQKVKSTEGVTVCIVTEAEKISEESWRILIPTIRASGAELWIEYNPRLEDDPTWQRFSVHCPPSWFARKIIVNWDDNPYFPLALKLERQQMIDRINAATDDDERAQLQDDYDHVWGGHCQKRSDAAIFRRRVVVEPFEEPVDVDRLFYGADWGFANDPTALVRFYVHNDELFITHEAFGTRVELDEIWKLFAGREGATDDQLRTWTNTDDRRFHGVPGARDWPIKADSARPETISFVKRQGFNISAAEKWEGSVEDGVEHIKAFRKIHIHPRCKNMEREARLYQYKIDKKTQQVLPVILDANNHGWDAIRYGLDGYIQRRGVNKIWETLAR